MSGHAAPPGTFHERIDVALQNVGLQRALGSIILFTGVRDNAVRAMPDWEELRTRANATKRDAIQNLPRYLDQLEAAVTARGGHVYRAADPRQACEYIGQVVDRRVAEGGARTVVKSKSMVTEEIGLNHFLEEHGVEVVETDLGEYIIQLAGQTPSHIVAPAIHMTRHDVAALFRDRLRAEVSGDDIPGMTALARRLLREKFLRAGVGISGVNFAVAESGTVVIVENEGNARLSTSVPKVHIAVMGIEKILPRLADLAVFLKLLARSATGQKMSSYVSFLTGPRRAGEPDGPEEFHLVMLDNGRSKLADDPLRRETLYCIRCGACLNVCPVFRKIGGHAYPWVYSGPIGAILSPQIQGPDAEPLLPFASSLCGACRDVCPVKIRIPELLLELRRQEVTAAPQRHSLESLAFGVWSWVMRHPWAYEMAGRLGRLAGGQVAVGPFAEWARTRELPRPPRESFREVWRRRKRP
jgi:L-lactate dehydrogenase complex protein LldF